MPSAALISERPLRKVPVCMAQPCSRHWLSRGRMVFSYCFFFLSLKKKTQMQLYVITCSIFGSTMYVETNKLTFSSSVALDVRSIICVNDTRSLRRGGPPCLVCNSAYPLKALFRLTKDLARSLVLTFVKEGAYFPQASQPTEPIPFGGEKEL